MNISQKIKQIIEEDNASEQKTKQMLEMAEKKYHLEKDFRDISFKLSSKQTQIKELGNEVIKLGSEFIVLEKENNIAMETLQDLVKKVVEEEQKTEALQVSRYMPIKIIGHLNKISFYR